MQANAVLLLQNYIRNQRIVGAGALLVKLQVQREVENRVHVSSQGLNITLDSDLLLQMSLAIRVRVHRA